MLCVRRKACSKPRPARVPKECQPKPYDFGPSYTYCQANMPSADSYTVPAGQRLVSLQLVHRHGDRSPVNLLPYTDVAYNLCNTTASLGFYEQQPLQESFRAARRQPRQQAVGGPEGRRLEEKPQLGPVSTANPYAARLWQGNCMQGQLTSRGVAQLHAVGESLRSIYVDKLGFLPSTYVRDNTSYYLRSTDIWRTRQSAESLLSGLWPVDDLSADVIPVHVFPAEVETMYANTAACAELAKINSAQYASDGWRAHLNRPDIWQVLDGAMGIGKLAAWHDGYDHVYDTLQTRQCHGLAMPCARNDPSKCVTQDVADFVYAQGDWEYRYLFNEGPYATQRAQYGMSAFMSVIRDVMRAHVSGNASVSSIGAPQFAHYSGHDTTLGPVLGFLNVTGFRWPPYASQMLFELWQADSAPSAPGQADPATFSVRVIYNGVVLPLYAAGCCDELCPFPQLLAYFDAMIPDNLPDACNAGA